MAAGAELFAERGYDGVTVDALAERAGANKALISYHFGGKAGLYTAIVKSTFEAVAADMRGLRDDTRPADESLRACIRLIGQKVSRQPSLPRMLLREILSGGERLPDEVLPHFLAVFETVRSIVERGVRTRRFRRVDPAATHIGLIGSLMFFFSTARFRERKLAALRKHLARPLHPPSNDDFIAHIEELMVRGLAARPAAARAGR
jgi:AcrR family transcriptional regulator